MLILILLVCIGLLLALIFWTIRSNSFLHVRTIKRNVVLLGIAQSFILSLQIGRLSWLRLANTAQQYTDFVSGTIGFTNTSKTIEYYALLIAIIVFVAFFIIILKIYEINDEDNEYEQGLIKLSLYALVPSAIMAGQSLRMENTDILLKTSYAFIVLSLLVVCFLRFLLKKTVINPEDVFRVGCRLMLGVTFLGVSEFGAALFLPKFGILLTKVFGFVSTKFGLSTPTLSFGIITYKFGIISVLVLIILVFLVLRFKTHMEDFEDKLDAGVALSQLGIPLLFSALLSPPVVYSSGVITLFHYRLILFVIVFGLGIIAYIDLFWRFKGKNDNSVGRLVSPWILVAILVYLQSINTGWPNIALDEYHFGEFYLPWWSFKQFEYLPYVDFQPARGLVNYIPGLLSWLFYDNTFSGQSLIINQFSALYVFLTFFSLRKIVGDFVAFLSVATLFSYAGLPSGNLIVVIACLAVLLKSSFDKSFIKAFWLWVGFSIFIPLFTIAEGSVFILGTLPLGFWLLFQAYRNSRKSLMISLGVFFLIAGVLAFTTDLDRVLFSAVRYLLEESGVNDVANGIIWRQPKESYQMVTVGYLWQFIRFSWLLLLVPIVVRLVHGKSRKETIQDQLFLVALFIFCIILIPRAAGRIDPSLYSRPGLTSIAMIFCALPLVILPPIKNNFHKAGAILLLALFFGLLGNQERYARNAMSLYRQVIYEPDPALLAREVGLSNIGNKALMDENQLKRQVRIKRVLDQILAPQETYFDATNHIADYGFQGRPSPVSVPAIYNASSTPVQIRMIDQLEDKQISLVLLYGENIAHDGGTISLRNYAIYEYLIKEFSPFQDEFGHIWMIRKGEEERLTNTDYDIGSKEESLALLSSTFWQKEISGLPAAWGNSVQSLSNRMTNPQDILRNGVVESIHGLQLLENGDWQVNGSDPFIVFTLPQDVKGDLLLIETSQKITGDFIQVFWESDLVPSFNDNDSFLFRAESSKYIVPFSAAPSWYLSESVRKIRIDFPDTYPGIIHFNTISLFERILK